tara:strand:- start:153 stop:650 length:498 start_codon:yes stop_codon:yes gene_type:complete
MKNLKSICFVFLLLIGITFTSCNKEVEKTADKKVTWNQEDEKLVTAAISDYVEGLYLVDSSRIEKSVDSTLRKIGYWYNPDEKAYRDNLPMTYTQLVNLAASWNKFGNRTSETSPKEIEIYDVNTKTASAKLTAEWGVDYFHLSKVNDQWKIVNVIWQSMPKIDK